MILLFNSGYRELYRKNVLNTMHLPAGHSNRYRYSCNSRSNYIHPELMDVLSKETLDEERCVILFVERSDNTQYVYHPIRSGFLQNSFVENGQCHFDVELESYLFASDPSGLTGRIMSVGDWGGPRLEVDNGNHVGYFAVYVRDEFLNVDEIESGDDVWAGAIDRLIRLVVKSAK